MGVILELEILTCCPIVMIFVPFTILTFAVIIPVDAVGMGGIGIARFTSGKSVALPFQLVRYTHMLNVTYLLLVSQHNIREKQALLRTRHSRIRAHLLRALAPPSGDVPLRAPPSPIPHLEIARQARASENGPHHLTALRSHN